VAIDVLRGLAIAVMIFVDLPGRYGAKPQPLQHTVWAGLRLADVVFPAFLVASGAALALQRRRRSTWSILGRAGRLAILGVVLVDIHYSSWSIVSGVLQFIAGSWLIGALAMRLGARGRFLLAVGLMAATLVAHAVPLAGHYTSGWGPHGIDDAVDSFVFGGRSDQGLVGLLGGGVTVILASLVAQWVIATSSAATRVRRLLGCGALVAVMGLALEFAGVPVVKRLWSPSFVLITLAWCLAVWAALEVMLVSRLVRRGLQPAVALSRNAVSFYALLILLVAFLPATFGDSFVDWFEPRIGMAAGSLMFSAGVVAVFAVVAMVLDRWKIVLRV
jgi:predicted acyltransferase